MRERERISRIWDGRPSFQRHTLSPLTLITTVRSNPVPLMWRSVLPLAWGDAGHVAVASQSTSSEVPQGFAASRGVVAHRAACPPPAPFSVRFLRRHAPEMTVVATLAVPNPLAHAESVAGSGLSWPEEVITGVIVGHSVALGPEVIVTGVVVDTFLPSGAGTFAVPGSAAGSAAQPRDTIGSGAAAPFGGAAASPPMPSGTMPPCGAATTGNKMCELPFHKELKTFLGHTGPVYCCAFATTGERFVTVGADKSVRVWTATEGTFTVMKGGVPSIKAAVCDFCPNGEIVVSAVQSENVSLRLWNAVTGKQLHTVKNLEEHWTYCTQFSPTGAHFLSGARALRLWNTETATVVVTLKGHMPHGIYSCGFSNTDGGQHCLSGSGDHLIKMWDCRGNRDLRTFSGHDGAVWSCRFSHSDRYIISTSMTHELKLWDAGSGRVIRNFKGHGAPTQCALFTGDDRYVLSCARDGNVMIWETETGNLVDTLTRHRGIVFAMDVQGNMLLTSSHDEAVKLWQLNLP